MMEGTVPDYIEYVKAQFAQAADDLADADIKSVNGRVKSRFEVGHHIEGLIDIAASRADAMDIAEAWASDDTGYSDAQQKVRVFDSMAHRGQPNEWAIVQRHWEPVSFRPELRTMAQVDIATTL